MKSEGWGGRAPLRSRRVPHEDEPNELHRRLEAHRRAGRPILDLTESNPTRVGLSRLDEAARAALAPERLSTYEPDPRGARPAREAVAAYLEERAAASGRPLAAPFDPDAVLLTAGTSEAYAHLFRLLCDPGDRVLAPRPSYPLIAPLAALEGVELATYRLVYDGRWRPDLESLEAALLPGTRALLVVEPNNPTASVLRPEEAGEIVSICERAGLSLVSDEVFGDFPWSPGGAPLPGHLGTDRVPTFVLGGISKLCGLPQLKLGWIAVSGPARARREAIRGLEWIGDLFLTVAGGVQHALPRILGSRGPYLARVSRRIRENLAALDRAAEDSGAYERLEGDGGWTAVLRVATGRSGELGGLAALERGVYVHPGHFYDLPDDRYAAVSLLPEPAEFREALARLAPA
ncbi:MAG TPA: pyridoxal phosphate-dependent aminotransferase [Candidatus Eisenbacteria bacterium]